MIREDIYVALAALLRTVPNITVFERTLRHWTDVAAEEMPYICLTQGNERHTTVQPGLRDRVQLLPKLYLYVRTGDPTVAPGTLLNPILDAIQGLFGLQQGGPMVANKQTLCGLVEHARVDGETQTFEGTLGDIEVAIIPLELLTVSSS